MNKNKEDVIKKLKERIESLEKQKSILFDAVDICSMADGIILSLRDNNISEAIEKIEYIRNHAINTMAEVVTLNKPFDK